MRGQKAGMGLLALIPIALLVWFLFFSGIGIGGLFAGGISPWLIVVGVILLFVFFTGGRRRR